MNSLDVAEALGRLPAGQAERLVELATFPAGKEVPGAVVALLWAATGGLTGEQSRRLGYELARRQLIDEYGVEAGDVTLGPAVHSRLVEMAGPDRPAGTAGTLLDAAGPLPAGGAGQWWTLPDSHAFLLGHVAELLSRAGRQAELDRLVTDLRWVEVRLRRHGVAAVLSDLARSAAPAAAALARAIDRARPLLGPIEPAPALGPLLAGRLADVAELRPIVAAYAAALPVPRLANRWALPDHPHPALWRELPAGSGVRGVAIAPDGTWLAGAGDDGTVRLWDTATGAPLGALAGHRGAAAAVAIAPDGTWLASAGDDGTVRVWDTAGQAARTVLTGHDGAVTGVAIAPDGRWLASTGADGTVRLWDAATGVLTGHQGAASGVAIAPDGRWLASAGADGTVRLWDAATRAERSVLAVPGATCVVIAPDGEWLATGGADGTVLIWDAATGAQRATLTGHRSAVRALAVAPDGRWLAGTGNDSSVLLWDAATGAVTASGLGHRGAAPALAIAPDGAWLVSGGGDIGGTLSFWRVADAARPHERPRNADSVAVAGDGTWLAAIEAAAVPIRDLATGAERLRLPRGQHQVAIAPDGTWAAAAGYDQVRVYSTADGAERTALTKHLGWVWTVAISPDGTWLATGDDGSRRFGQVGRGAVRIWDAATGKRRRILRAHQDAVTRVAIAPDGTWLASAGRDGKVRVWDPVTGELCAEWRSFLHLVNDLAIAPDGSWLALVGSDPDVRILDTASGALRAQWRGRGGWVDAVAIAPDGGRVAVARGNRLEIREAAQGRVLTATRVDGKLRACAWLPDGRGVCAAGRSGTYLFDVVG